MKFVCLVYGEERTLQAFSPERMVKLDADSVAYDKSLEASGHLLVAQALQPVRKSKCVRRRNGRTTVTDGPFAETKEQLLGFLYIEARDIDAALEIAQGVPLAEFGTIEVRAIYDVPGRER